MFLKEKFSYTEIWKLVILQPDTKISTSIHIGYGVKPQPLVIIIIVNNVVVVFIHPWVNSNKPAGNIDQHNLTINLVVFII
jgi:hypothetical protein